VLNIYKNKYKKADIQTSKYMMLKVHIYLYLHEVLLLIRLVVKYFELSWHNGQKFSHDQNFSIPKPMAGLFFVDVKY